MYINAEGQCRVCMGIHNDEVMEARKKNMYKVSGIIWNFSLLLVLYTSNFEIFDEITFSCAILNIKYF